MLDTATGQQQARFELQLAALETPRTIATSADGSRLFITTSPFDHPFVGSSSETFLHVLDASTGERLARIATPWAYGKAVVTPDGSRAFLLSANVPHTLPTTTMTIVDLATFTSQLTTVAALNGCPVRILVGDAPERRGIVPGVQGHV